MIVISLTTEQAAAVRGDNASGTAMLDPIQVADDQFILPLRVLDDPAHASHHAFLASLPQFDYTPPASDDD